MSWLTDEVTRWNREDINDARSILDHSVDNGSLRQLVHDRLQKLTSGLVLPDAYLHPNEFTKIRLAAVPRQWAVRLHFWSGTAKTSDIHNHRWDFASRILQGQIAERTFALTEGGAQWILSECTRTEQEYSVDPIRHCTPCLVHEVCYKAGDSYSRPFSEFHEVGISPVSPTVSVVLQGKTRTNSSMLVRQSAEVVAISAEKIERLTLEQEIALMIQTLDCL